MSVDADVSDSVDLFGKTVSELQEGIKIEGDKITGTLYYVDDYTGFDPSNPELQAGNYLVLHCEVSEDPEAAITVTVTNPSVLDEDGIIVLRIADKDSQTVTVVASNDKDKPVEKVFDISGLTTLNQ